MLEMKNLKLLREEQGISQKKLADAIGTNQQNIHRYETNLYEPDLNTLKLLAEYFNTSIDYLVGITAINRKIEYVDKFELNEEEGIVVENYRKLSIRQKQGISFLLNVFLEK